jgi:hypothetical protein
MFGWSQLLALAILIHGLESTKFHKHRQLFSPSVVSSYLISLCFHFGFNFPPLPLIPTQPSQPL